MIRIAKSKIKIGETFYRYQRAIDDDGIQALLDKNRRVPNVKNRVDELTEKAVLDFAIEYPAYGQLRASNELRLKTGSPRPHKLLR